MWRIQIQSNVFGDVPVMLPIGVLEHKDRVVNVAWSQSNEGLLATALYGKKVRKKNYL